MRSSPPAVRDESSAHDAAAALIYEAILDPSMGPAALAAVGRCVEASRVARFRFSLQTSAVWDLSTLGYEGMAQAAYLAHYARIDPGWPVAAASPVGVWLCDEDLMDERDRGQQEFIRDWAHPNGMGRVGGVKLFAAGASAVFFSVHRDVSAPRFGAEGRAAFGRLLPHLMRAERLRGRLGELADSEAIARAALDQFGAAAFVVDERLRPHAANAKAEALFAQAGGLTVAAGSVCAGSPNDSRALLAAVRRATSHQGGAGALLLPPHGPHGPLQVMVLPLAHSMALAHLANRSLALVVVADPFDRHLSVDLYRQLFGLSEAEASLASAIAHGSSVKRWAALRRVSIATVRTQLAMVFRKTGVSTQPALMKLLRTLPAVQPPDSP